MGRSSSEKRSRAINWINKPVPLLSVSVRAIEAWGSSSTSRPPTAAPMATVINGSRSWTANRDLRLEAADAQSGTAVGMLMAVS